MIGEMREGRKEKKERKKKKSLFLKGEIYQQAQISWVGSHHILLRDGICREGNKEVRAH